MATKSKKVTLQDVEASLPSPPEGFSYEVEQVSTLIIRVWLLHPNRYTYTPEQVRTVHCFIKSGKVYPARNWKTPRIKSVGTLIDLKTLSSYTVINRPENTLLNLL